MNQKHTEGDWRIASCRATNEDGTTSIEIETDGQTIAAVYPCGEEEANAQLIKSAPKMLAALIGAEKAIRKALPHVERADPDNDAVKIEEWLGEIQEAITAGTE